MRAADYIKAVGSVIRELRSAEGLSQEELAENAKMSRNMLSLVETGGGNLSLRKIVELTKALGLTPGELLARVEKRLR